MNKTEITLSLDSEKMRALTFYLAKESSTVQKKMDEALRQLYEQAVPEALREYLDAQAESPKPKRPPRPSQPKGEQSKVPTAPTGEHKEGSV